MGKAFDDPNAEDEYYLGLYERHADARAGRRNRRRVTGSGQRSLRKGRGALDAYFRIKSRKSQLCLRKNYVRLIAVVLFLFFIGYEIIALRNPLLSPTNNDLPLHVPSSPPVIPPHVQTIVLPKPIAPATQQEPEQDAKILSSLPASTSSAVLVNPRPRSQTETPRAQTNSQLSNNATFTSNKAQERSSSGDPESANDIDVTKQPNQVAKPHANKGRSPALPIGLKKMPSVLKAEQPMIAPETAPDLPDTLANEPADADNFETESQSRINAPKFAKPKATKPVAGFTRKSRPSKVPKQIAGSENDSGALPGADENFWRWFQESKGTEGSGPSSVDCPDENKRLCQMFYKFIRKYKIRTIYDVSCAKNIGWMPIILHKIGNELWGFKYHCSEHVIAELAEAKNALKEFKFVEYDDRMWWKDGFPSDVELVFAWDVLPHTAYGRVWSFFVHARKQEVTYILVDNYPGMTNDPSPQRTHLNLRKHPFRFPAAKEVVQNITEPGETEKRQLLFYETVALPANIS
jgi:hypothetical protein